jgi:hypothetical protein
MGLDCLVKKNLKHMDKLTGVYIPYAINLCTYILTTLALGLYETYEFKKNPYIYNILSKQSKKIVHQYQFTRC